MAQLSRSAKKFTMNFMNGAKMIKYGFIAYTGQKWTNHQVDLYNAMTKRILSFGDNPPDHLLNARHKLFVMFSIKEK